MCCSSTSSVVFDSIFSHWDNARSPCLMYGPMTVLPTVTFCVIFFLFVVFRKIWKEIVESFSWLGVNGTLNFSRTRMSGVARTVELLYVLYLVSSKKIKILTKKSGEIKMVSVHRFLSLYKFINTSNVDRTEQNNRIVLLILF